MGGVLAAHLDAFDEEHGDREFQFDDRDFAFIRRLVHAEAGIALSDAKRHLVYGRLSRRLRHLRLARFSDYCALLESDGGHELRELINAITTNLTSFFREMHHFTYLRQTLVPQLVAQNAATRRIRVWSAGCSTGEEPYSIAMTLRESVPPGWDVRILATDIDSRVIDTAEAGIYAEERVEAMDPVVRKRWIRRGRGAQAGRVRVAAELREMITFRRLNLMDAWPMRGPFDVLFCRNVVIYFDKETQAVLFGRYADLLAPRGHLFIGHSENLWRVSDRFEPLGHTMYRKKA